MAKPTDNRAKLLIAAVLAFAAAYIFGSLAIDRGNWLYYGLAFIGFYFGCKYLFHAIRSLKRW